MTWLPQLHMRDKIFRIARTHNDAGAAVKIDATNPPKDANGKPILTEKYFSIDSSWARVERLWCMAQLMPTSLETAVNVVYGRDVAGTAPGAYIRTTKPPVGEVMNGKPHVKLIRRGWRTTVNDNIYALGDDQQQSIIQYPQGTSFTRKGVISSLYAVSRADESRAVVTQNQAFYESYPNTTRYPVTTRFTFYVMVFRP